MSPVPTNRHIGCVWVSFLFTAYSIQNAPTPTAELMGALGVDHGGGLFA